MKVILFKDVFFHQNNFHLYAPVSYTHLDVYKRQLLQSYVKNKDEQTKDKFILL